MFYTSPFIRAGELMRDSDGFMRQLRKLKLSKMDPSEPSFFYPETEAREQLIGISYFTELCK